MRHEYMVNSDRNVKLAGLIRRMKLAMGGSVDIVLKGQRVDERPALGSGVDHRSGTVSIGFDLNIL